MSSSVVLLSACGGPTSMPLGSESDPSKPAVMLSEEEASELLSRVDCETGVDPGNPAWRDMLTRYSGEPLAAVAFCVGEFGEPGQLKRYTGDLESLGALLAREDVTTPLPEGEGCDDYYDPQPNLWLVTASGDVYQPRWPLDECDHLLPPLPSEVFTADALTPLGTTS